MFISDSGSSRNPMLSRVARVGVASSVFREEVSLIVLHKHEPRQIQRSNPGHALNP
jgi:hypothetical protein